jgi:hypothetical protein
VNVLYNDCSYNYKPKGEQMKENKKTRAKVQISFAIYEEDYDVIYKKSKGKPISRFVKDFVLDNLAKK